MGRRTEHATVYDSSARPRILPASWRMGAWFDGAVSYPAHSRYHLVEQLERHIAKHGVPKGLSSWSHGSTRGLHWGDGVIEPEWLVQQVPQLRGTHGLHWMWLRCCDMFRNHDLAMRWANAFGCTVYGHCSVISGKRQTTLFGARIRIGMPWLQGEVVGLLPAQIPRWPVSGAGLPHALATRMRPDPRWIQPRLAIAGVTSRTDSSV